MKITHPMRDVWPNTSVPPDLEKLVASLPDLPTVELKSRIEWDKDSTSAPAGTYTDHSNTDVDAHVAKVLEAGKWPRRLLTIALNFRTTHDLNVVRRRLGVVATRPKAVVEEKAAPKADAPKAAAPKGSRPAKRQAAKSAA